MRIPTHPPCCDKEHVLGIHPPKATNPVTMNYRCKGCGSQISVTVKKARDGQVMAKSMIVQKSKQLHTIRGLPKIFQKILNFLQSVRSWWHREIRKATGEQ